MPEQTTTNNQSGTQQQSAGGQPAQGGTPGAQGAGGGQQSGQDQQSGGTPFVYDAWLAQQPDDVRAGLEAHTQGLRNTVQATRQERDDLARQLRDAAKGATGDTKAQLDKLMTDLEAANARADFYQEAGRPEIGCTNAGLAYIAAEQAGLIDKRGRVNWAEMRKQYPELFRAAQQQPPAGHAGTGTGGTPPAQATMNDFIRRSAGRG
jgi:hypothetical protein